MKDERRSAAAEDRFRVSMAGRTFNGSKRAIAPAAAAIIPPAPAQAARPPDPEGLLLGERDTGGGIAIDLARLLVGRLLIQGGSGAGKSWTLRRILEQAAGLVQVIVVDPEDEFGSLAAEFGILHVPGHQLDPAAARRLALRVREHRISLVLDLSQLKRDAQMILVTAFLEALIEAPREHWHPALVAIDEAQLFAPFGGHLDAPPAVRKAAIGAVVDVMSRGRKRGLAGVLATLRLARIATSVRSEIQNFLIGLNTQDIDIKRAAELLGWPVAKASDRLPMLLPGEFVAVGRAFSSQPAQLKVGAVASAHRGAAPAIAAPDALTVDEARRQVGLEEILAEAAEDAEVIAANDDRLNRGTRAVRDFIRDPSFVVAAYVFGSLKAIVPQGTTMKALAAHLEVGLAEVGQAVALLDQFGVLEFGDAGAGRPIAIDREFARHAKPKDAEA